MPCGQMRMKMLTLASGLITSMLVLSFRLEVPQVHAQISCNYYASPNGTGNGLSPSTPFQVSKFWSVATPGKTLCLLNGTYTDDNSLIQVPTSFAGTASQPITIRALNDGKVLIDSGGSRPIDLQGSYGILEGINSQGADNAAIRFRGSHWTVRRVMVWNNGPHADTTLGDFSGDHNTLEDCALFGKARIILTVGSAGRGPSYNTVRRCWLRWEYRTGTGSPDVVAVQGYAGQNNVIFENLISTRDRQPGSSYGHQTDPPIQMASTQDSKVLGSIAYAPAGAKFEANNMFVSLTGGGCRAVDNLCFPYTARNLFKDNVAVASPLSEWFGTQFVGLEAVEGANNVVENIVGITGRFGGCEARGWLGCDKIRWGTTLAAAIGPGKSIWNEVPGICKRYVNGTLTNEPLWPWPMNQRIKDALVQSGRAPVDITATMEQLLGPIPSQCRNSR